MLSRPFKPKLGVPSALQEPYMCSAQADYPFFTTVNRVLNGELPPSAVVEYRKKEHHAPLHSTEGDTDAWIAVDASVSPPV